MKAKFFRRLRRKCKYYMVEQAKGKIAFLTENPRTSFDPRFSTKVYARNEKEAVERAIRKGFAKGRKYNGNTTTMQYATFRVREADERTHWSNIKYLR